MTGLALPAAREARTAARPVTRRLVAIVDKAFPPDHSFVSGMLADALPRAAGVRVTLVCERGAASRTVARVGRARCVAALAPRRGAGRLRGALQLVRLLRRLGPCDAVLVRNDPLRLAVAALCRPRGARLVFQSSFPHIEALPGSLRAIGASLLWRFAGPAVDAVLAVSPDGLARLSRRMPRARGGWIPLLVEPWLFDVPRRPAGDDGPLQLLYVGSHDADRSLDAVLTAIAAAADARPGRLRATFVGGTAATHAPLLRTAAIAAAVRDGTITLHAAVPRRALSAHFAAAHVGLSLIPPRPRFLEASPTKLGEYAAAGLTVLVSTGIRWQDTLAAALPDAYATSFDVGTMTDAIVRLVDTPRDALRAGGAANRTYARQHLTYTGAVEELCRLLW
jgi:hypothetical protein